jgi:hypothetical protein
MNDETSNAEEFNIGIVIEQAKKVVLDPIGFYRNMPTSGGYANPIIFLVVMTAATMVIAFVFSLIGLAKFNPMIGGVMTISMLIIMPIFAVLGSFIAAAIMFVIWKLMGSQKDYETAYRCVAYSFAIGPVIAVISFIPYVANLVKALWGCFLLYTASVEVHDIKAKTAMIVFGIFAALNIMMSVGVERSARTFQSKFGNYNKEIEKAYNEGSVGAALEKMENMDEMTPEEAGKQFGELMKGLGEFSKAMEESAAEAEESEKDD